MLRKYPRTRHVTGSRFGPGDDGLESVPVNELLGRYLVIEEKMDGANCGVSFSGDAELKLQSRGHFLTGGPRERHFDLFKRWAHAHQEHFFDALGDRYVMYGEWLHAKHTVFYDALPHYFMEFDVLDRSTDQFLDTPARAKILAGVPVIPVKILFAGRLKSGTQLRELIGPSHFISSEAPAALWELALRLGLDPDLVARQSDTTGVMEGLYLKVEEEGVVKERLKFVRDDFTSRIIESDEHWRERPIIPNQLSGGVDLFSGSGQAEGAP